MGHPFSFKNRTGCGVSDGPSSGPFERINCQDIVTVTILLIIKFKWRGGGGGGGCRNCARGGLAQIKRGRREILGFFHLLQA